jgi:lysozyme family protein
VVSFWLGSSEGSRRKDVAAFALQRQQAQQTADIVRSSSAQAGDVIRAQGTKNTPQPAATKASAPAGGARSNFNKCLDLVLVYEGGFSNHPADPGGATNLGITKATLEHWRKETVSVEDVKALKVEEAAEIYRSNYWNALNCSALPAGVDLIVFDFGVNAGPSRSAKLLQKAVGANQDGSIGPATLAAVTASLPADIIQSMTAGRLDFYRGLPGWETFKNGWTRRTNDIAKAALAMALG